MALRCDVARASEGGCSGGDIWRVSRLGVEVIAVISRVLSGESKVESKHNTKTLRRRGAPFTEDY